MRTLSRTTTDSGGWTSSSFDRGPDRLEWRYDGEVVHLRHSGHDDEGTLTLPLMQWKSFVAAAQVGQAGSVAY